MKGRILMKTERLLIREMTQDDLGALCDILCDADVMRAAYETPFTPGEAQGWRDGEVLEIGYLFQKTHWHKGYATEAAITCKKYAFSVLHANSVHSIVRDTNIAAQNVALRNGMKLTDRDIKTFRGTDMLFHLYTATQPDNAE